MALLDKYQDDPKEFFEFMVNRWPVASQILIEEDKTDFFGYPIEVDKKFIAPLGLEQGINYVFTKTKETEGYKYMAMFQNHGSDKFMNSGITNLYYKDKYGDLVSRPLTKEENTKVRNEYKKLMREFSESNYENLRYASNLEFEIMFDIFRKLYKKEGHETSLGINSYILDVVFGKDRKVYCDKDFDMLLKEETIGVEDAVRLIEKQLEEKKTEREE